MSVPHSLVPVETYFTRANELSGPHPFVAYHVRKFGFELAMKMKGADAGQFLLAQMEILEKEKGTVKPPLHQPPPYPDPNWKPPAPPAAAENPVAPAEPPAASEGVTEAAGAPAADGADAVKKEGDDNMTEAEKKEGDEKKGGFMSNAFSFMSKQPPKSPTPEDGVAALSVEDKKPDVAAPAPAPKPPMITPPKVAASPHQAMRTLALDLYERGRQADKPDVYPSPSTSFGVTTAPAVARCLHAAAVILDSLKQFDVKLPPDLERFQKAAHARSVKLGGQINSAFKFKDGEPIPLTWRPADMSAATPLPPNLTPPPPPPVAPSLFPSVPGGR